MTVRHYRLRPEVIDRARERLGVSSDEQLAVHIGISAGTVRNVRAGQTPSLATAIKLLDAAGIGIPVGVSAA